MNTNQIAAKVLARLSTNAMTSLEWSGSANIGTVAADAQRVSKGDYSVFLSECLSGCGTEGTVADGYREYVQCLSEVVEADTVVSR